MQRVLVDLKAAEGREAFLRLAERRRRHDRELPPRRRRPPRHRLRRRAGRNPRIVYCSTTGFGQTGPRSQWAGHDLNYLAVGGFLHCTGRGADGQPPIPGATVADSAGGGMHAVMAILAALVRRATTGEGAYLDVSVADGVLALMALQVDEYLATGEEPGAAPRPAHRPLRVLRHVPGARRTLARGRRHRAALLGEPLRALGLEQWATHQDDDAVQDQIRADLRAVFATRDRDEWVAELAPPTRAWRRCSPCPS